MIWEPPKQLEKNKRVIARVPNIRKADTAMVAKRILYVNYNPATLIRDEESLMRAGYEVDTVFGIDGVMARKSVAGYASVAIHETCPLESRKKMISWLRRRLGL